MSITARALVGVFIVAAITTSVSSFTTAATCSRAHHHLSWTRAANNPSLSLSTTTATTTLTDEAATVVSMPLISPATNLPNNIYNWRGYNIRYQVSGPINAKHTLLLVHGLFVNADHWRKLLTTWSATDDTPLKNTNCCRVYAIDLLGCGWSDKPSRNDELAKLVNGENGRFTNDDTICYYNTNSKKRRTVPILSNIPLGTAAGGNRLASSLELRHPLGSLYNFYTWAEQLVDFTRDVIHSSSSSSSSDKKKVTLVANSIGTMSSLQAIIDEPTLYNGCFIVNPNFRELHSAEIPLSTITMPIIRQIQQLLRSNGQSLFNTLATPPTVKQILKEPYSNHNAIDDELITVLLDPLLTLGASDVVFDTLSYSAGPLPEQQLSSVDFPNNCPVWVVYGKDDPWTPSRRVENLSKVCISPDGEYGSSPVERIVGLDGAGHCPHDECPDEVNGLLMEFLDRIEG